MTLSGKFLIRALFICFCQKAGFRAKKLDFVQKAGFRAKSWISGSFFMDFTVGAHGQLELQKNWISDPSEIQLFCTKSRKMTPEIHIFASHGFGAKNRDFRGLKSTILTSAFSRDFTIFLGSQLCIGSCTYLMVLFCGSVKVINPLIHGKLCFIKLVEQKLTLCACDYFNTIVI